MKKNIAIIWKKGPEQGSFGATAAKISGADIAPGKGTVTGNNFSFTSAVEARLEIGLDEISGAVKLPKSIVSITTEKNSFSFFVNDVNCKFPIIIREYEVAVTGAQDKRDYKAIETAIRERQLSTMLQKIESEPEANYEQAVDAVKANPGFDYLGIGRDIRLFAISFYDIGSFRWHLIGPRFGVSQKPPLDEKYGLDEKYPWNYYFMAGRGVGCEQKVSRHLDDGFMPILHTHLQDGDIQYRMLSFAGLEKSALKNENVKGTHYLAADTFTGGSKHSPEIHKETDRLLADLGFSEEIVLYNRIKATNTSSAPRYAWFQSICPRNKLSPVEDIFEYEEGLGKLESGYIFAVSTLNGVPIPQEELSILLQPGESAVLEFFIPHRPIEYERGKQLLKQDFDHKLSECRNFWQNKQTDICRVKIPEKRIENILKNGLTHIDLVSYGLEPDAPLTPSAGVWTAYGGGSDWIIQFLDSLGLHKQAERSLQSFFDKQYPDGFIQNLATYMLETGAVLWTAGEHFRYTQDKEWVKRVKDKLLKSCEYLLNWRKRNMDRGEDKIGYGMIEGKCADPNDPYRYFMLNGFAYLGLSRISEMLENIDPDISNNLKNEAEALKKDIRKSFFKAMTKSPAVPLSSGFWVPTVPPWAEEAENGATCFYPKEGRSFSHSTFMCRDNIIGPLWLIYQEVIDPNEQAADIMINYHVDLMHQNNVTFSEPNYHSLYDRAHLQRGEIKAFLKHFYYNLASAADQETFSFWEHFYCGSPFKVGDEAQFLMRTRWMLWLEADNCLKLLTGIPRKWLENGNKIRIKKAKCYFGSFSLEVESKLNKGIIEARLEMNFHQLPENIVLRLPHPEKRQAVNVQGGIHLPEIESILICPSKNEHRLRIEF